MYNTTSEFRFGLGTQDVRGLTFKIERSKQEVYFFCREMTDFKHSFHTAKHRYAKNIAEPRKAVESTTLMPFIRGQYWTVARVVFTTATNWGIVRGDKPKKCTLVGVPSLGSVKMVSLGFTGHHPNESRHTDLGEANIACLKVNEDKFLTATVSDIPLSFFLNDIISLHAPHRDTQVLSFKNSDYTIKKMHDNIMHFRTKINTYFYWCHHNIDGSYDPVGLKISQALAQAHHLSKAGIVIGEHLKPFEEYEPPID